MTLSAESRYFLQQHLPPGCCERQWGKHHAIGASLTGWVAGQLHLSTAPWNSPGTGFSLPLCQIEGKSHDSSRHFNLTSLAWVTHISGSERINKTFHSFVHPQPSRALSGHTAGLPVWEEVAFVFSFPSCTSSPSPQTCS